MGIRQIPSDRGEITILNGISRAIVGFGLMLAGWVSVHTVRLGQEGTNLELYNSSIANNQFAIVGEEISGSSIYFGNLDGKAKWRIRSAHFLSMPFITETGKIIMVEKDYARTPTFSILEMDLSGAQPLCRKLLVSHKYILSPFTATGSLSGDILFFAGDYFPEIDANSVPIRSLTILSQGKVFQPEGPAFSTIGSLAQIGESKFLGVSYHIIQNIKSNTTQSIDTASSGHVVVLDVSRDHLSALPASTGFLRESNVVSVSASLTKGFSYLRGQEFKGHNSQDTFTKLDNETLQIAGSVQTPGSEFLFGDLVSAAAGRNSDDFIAMAEIRRDVGTGWTNFIAIIQGGSVTRFVPIDTSSANSVNLSNCDASEVVSF